MQERRLGDRARRVEKTYNRHTGEEETEDNTFGIEDGKRRRRLAQMGCSTMVVLGACAHARMTRQVRKSSSIKSFSVLWDPMGAAVRRRGVPLPAVSCPGRRPPPSYLCLHAAALGALAANKLVGILHLAALHPRPF